MATLAQELLDAQAQIATMTGVLQTVTAERDTFKANVDDLNAKLKAEQDGRAADAVAHKAALDDVNGKLTAEAAAHVETKNALMEANKKLADPAYQIAGTKGSEKPAPEGGQPPASQPLTKEQLEAEYRKIDGSTVDGARARADFRAKYKKELGL